MLERALTMELVGVEQAVTLMDFSTVPEYGNIVKNIIYLGLPELVRKTAEKLTGNRQMEKSNL